MSEQLKSCPFCEGGAKHFERHNPMSKWRHSIDCGTCGMSGPVEASKADAITAWNTRLAASPIGDEAGSNRAALVEIVKRLFDEMGLVDPDWEGADAEAESFVSAMLSALSGKG